MEPGRPEVAAGDHILDQSEKHSQPGDAEAQPPTDALADVADDQRRNEGTDVDAHVENAETGVTPRITLRVELSDNGAHVTLQHPGTGHQKDQSQVEERLAGHDQRELAA